MKNFALTGAAGYIAPRHLKAIHDTGNKLEAALDLNDSVGILDRYFPDALFFNSPERFERYIDKCRLGLVGTPIDYLSICTPNYLHDTYIRMSLRSNADAICEKPIVINPWNLDVIRELEAETGHKVYTILQLRLHPTLVKLKEVLENQANRERADIILTYITQRGPWYDVSWKGSEAKSGGIAMNIGVHFFDLCLWMFGDLQDSIVHLAEPRRMAGVLELEWARVRWFLSIEREDLPKELLEKGQTAYRSMLIDGEEIEFSTGFTDLHTEVYKNILEGRAARIEDARPSIEVVYNIRHSELTSPGAEPHPYLK